MLTCNALPPTSQNGSNSPDSHAWTLPKPYRLGHLGQAGAFGGHPTNQLGSTVLNPGQPSHLLSPRQTPQAIMTTTISEIQKQLLSVCTTLLLINAIAYCYL